MPSSSGAEPLSVEAFEALLTPIWTPSAPGGALAIGVSGGSDSMALLHLCAALRARHGFTLHVLSVDHGLRPEAAHEAAQVAQSAQALGAQAHILSWGAPKPSANIQAAAREARYRLMREWREANNVSDLAVAHTKDDAAETFLLRLARGSGVDGLAQMPPIRRDGATTRLLRPLLSISRAQLQETCNAFGAKWIEDPSNEDDQFERVKARKILKALAPLGLDGARLVKTAQTMSRARDALNTAAQELRKQAVRAQPALGYLQISPHLLADAPEEIGLRVLRDCLMAISGAPYPPRFEALQASFAAIASGGAGRTLHGCALNPGDCYWSIAREPAARPEPTRLSKGAPFVWDNCYEIEDAPLGAYIGAVKDAPKPLVKEALAQANGQQTALWRAAPHSARESACAIWTETQLLLTVSPKAECFKKTRLNSLLDARLSAASVDR